MSVRDIGFWLRSARTDSELARLRGTHDLAASFDLIYNNKPDPWAVALPCYRYQSLKYTRILSLLPARSYASALDVGCGLGVFTRMLARYADNVLGVDFSEVAVDQARDLSVDHTNVRYDVENVLALGRSGPIDLIVLTDVLYYLSPLTETALNSIVVNVADLLKPGGIVLLSNHCFFGFDSASRLVRKIHNTFRCSDDLEVVREKWHPFYLTTVFKKRSGAGHLPCAPAGTPLPLPRNHN